MFLEALRSQSVAISGCNQAFVTSGNRCIAARLSSVVRCVYCRQNKMWGLYAVPQAAEGDAPGTMNIKNLSIHTVQELRQLAKRENLPPPAPTNANV